MKAVANANILFGGLTVYVAFVLTHSAAAIAPPPAPVPLEPIPAAPAPSIYDRGLPNGAGESSGHPLAARHPLDMPTSQPAYGLATSPGTPTPFGPLPPPAEPFRDSPYGAHADPGPPGGPGYGHPHYATYQTRYGIWYQPRSYAEPAKQIYRPSPFRPRGLGNLLYDPCRQTRMDYTRAVIDDLPSQYGPAYYPNYVRRGECLVRPTRKYVPPVWGAADGSNH